ncbi:MAG: DUF6383 domain-containing protein, partial [Bacteroidales bacterium]|nr:DUF6383 domain-containing protein [Bacteroidales bacterium]
KFNNPTSSLLSAGFADAGTPAVKEINLSESYTIFTSKNSIRVDGLYNSDLSVFAVDGSLVMKETAISGKVEIPVNQGIYLIVINGKGKKVIVE